jgi:hypothetical protein
LDAVDVAESLKTAESVDEVSSSGCEDLSDVRVADRSESCPKMGWDAVRKRVVWDRKRAVLER